MPTIPAGLDRSLEQWSRPSNVLIARHVRACGRLETAGPPWQISLPMEPLAIATDTFVTLSYVLFDEQGEAVDRASPEEPLTYVHGYAQIVPGLERALKGLHAGERREVIVEPEEAFGEHEDAG